MSTTSVDPRIAQVRTAPTPSGIDLVNGMSNRDLRKLTSQKIKEIISNHSEISLDLPPSAYESLGKRLHLIRSRPAARLFAWVARNASSDKLTLTINNIKEGRLTKILDQDFNITTRVLRKKIALTPLKFQDTLYQASITHQMDLLSLTKKQYKEWVRAPNPDAYLLSIENNFAPNSIKRAEAIQKKYGTENLHLFINFINSRRERLKRLADCHFLLKKYQAEQHQVKELKRLFKTATRTNEDYNDELLDSLIDRLNSIKDEEENHRLKPCTFDYTSHFDNEKIVRIKDILAQRSLSDYIKIQLISFVLNDVLDTLEQSIDYIEHRKELFSDPSPCEEDLEKLKKCIADDEESISISDDGHQFLKDFSKLEKSFDTSAQFTAVFQANRDNPEKLKELKIALKKQLSQIRDLKATGMELSGTLNKWFNIQDYRQQWFLYVKNYHQVMRASSTFTDIIKFYHGKENTLKESVKLELDKKYNRKVWSIVQDSLTIQIPLKLKQLNLSSEKPVAERSESDWGFHHKISHRLKLVNERLRELSASSADSFVAATEEDNDIEFVTKIAELGITADRLAEAPFSIPKQLEWDEEQYVQKVNWLGYAAAFKAKGISYSDIAGFEKLDDFVLWYQGRVGQS